MDYTYSYSVYVMKCEPFECLRALNVGGNWNNSARAGFSAFNSNNAWSYSNANFGSRLAIPS